MTPVRVFDRLHSATGSTTAANGGASLTETDAYTGGIDMSAAEQLTRTLFQGLQSWRNDAACKGLKVAWFFPEHDDAAVEMAKAAKRVCAECPVRDDCLDWALKNERYYGVFGGMTVLERRRELQRRGMTDARYAIPRPYQCGVCGATFTTAPRYLNHVSKHQAVA